MTSATRKSGADPGTGTGAWVQPHLLRCSFKTSQPLQASVCCGRFRVASRFCSISKVCEISYFSSFWLFLSLNPKPQPPFSTINRRVIGFSVPFFNPLCFFSSSIQGIRCPFPRICEKDGRNIASGWKHPNSIQLPWTFEGLLLCLGLSWMSRGENKWSDGPFPPKKFSCFYAFLVLIWFLWDLSTLLCFIVVSYCVG